MSEEHSRERGRGFRSDSSPIFRCGSVLLAVPEAGRRTWAEALLRHDGHRVVLAHSGTELLHWISSALARDAVGARADIAIVEESCLSELRVLEAVRRIAQVLPVIVLEHRHDDTPVDVAVGVLVLKQPLNKEDLRVAVQSLLRT